jgi:Sensors of blue-light using FAD
VLVRCLYASHAVGRVSAETVDAILEQSRRNNPKAGITGMLCFTDDVFIQVIEGGRDPVCELFNAIVRDERHSGVRLLLFEEIAERSFGVWTMGKVDFARTNQALLLKYFEKAALDPFAASGHATLSLLSELIRSGSINGRGKAGE